MLKILFFGVLGDICGREMALEMPDEGRTLNEIRDAVCERFPLAAPSVRQRCTNVCVDQEIVRANVRLRSGQELAFLPPLSGG